MANQLTERITLDSSKFDENIQKVIRKVEELKQQGNKVGGGFDSSMGKMIQKATGFNGSLSSLVGVVGKFGVGLGVVTTAGEAFGKMLHSSQTLGDSFGATQQSVNTVVDNFFRSLASGDFSPFLNGMDNMVSHARAAYNAMDELWNMAQSFGVQNARLNNKFNENLNKIRKLKDKDDEKSKKEVARLKQENQNIINTQKEGGEKLYNKTIEGVREKITADSGLKVTDAITEDVIFNVLENDINDLEKGRKKYKEEYQKYLKERNALAKKHFSGPTKGGGGALDKLVSRVNPDANLGPQYQKELTKLQNKYVEAIIGNTVLNGYSDKELEGLNNQMKEGLGYQGVAIANDAKMLRYSKENNEEKELFDYMYKASKDGILEPKEFERWAKNHYTTFFNLFSRIKNNEINRLKANNHIYTRTSKEECKKRNVMDDTIYEESKKLLGLKKFLQEFSSIDTKETMEVHIWDHYLMFAYLFGIADKVMKQLKKLYPEVLQQDNFDYNTFVLINSFSTSTVHAASSARHAAESYSSGGGGFSIGGGGGGSFGGGGFSGGGSR